MISEKKDKNKNLRGQFWELSYESLKISSVKDILY